RQFARAQGVSFLMQASKDASIDGIRPVGLHWVWPGQSGSLAFGNIRRNSAFNRGMTRGSSPPRRLATLMRAYRANNSRGLAPDRSVLNSRNLTMWARR